MARPVTFCVINDCARQAYGHGWCSLHYQRWRRNGDPLATKQLPRGTYQMCTVAGCDRTHLSRGYCIAHWNRWRNTGDPGAEEIAERGGAVGYAGVHHRLASQRGLASAHTCEHCGGVAHGWAYDHRDPDELHDGRGRSPYSLDLDRYLPLCGSCHKLFDNAARAG